MKEESPFICSTCDANFASKGNLNKHQMAEHEGMKSYKCSICVYTSSYKGNLNKHISMVHEGKNKNSYIH